MSSILIPVIVVTIIGLICAIMLVFASKVMSVPEDEKFVAIRGCLPGANCGACGYAGCDGYAHALADGNASATNLCVPGGDPAAAQIASILGVEAQDVIEKVAVIACCGDSSCTKLKYEYQGISSCAAANLLFSGDGVCSHGCLGYGDCLAVCPNNAICIEDGLARVIPTLCAGCGMCAKACPNHLIHIVPDVFHTVVRCSSTDTAGIVRKACSKGCIGCKKCETECPADAITVVNNRAVIDYDKCVDCGHCVDICISGCIVYTDLTSKTKVKAV